MLGIMLIVFVLLEYWNKSLQFTDIDQKTRVFYAILNQRADIKVIVDLPIGNRIRYEFKEARGEDLDAHYLLWAIMLHDKVLFNGYTGFLPWEYYQRAALLSIGFPTAEKLKSLRNWGVDGIILHRDEFNLLSEFYRIKNELEALDVSLATSSSALALFDLTVWPEGD